MIIATITIKATKESIMFILQVDFAYHGPFGDEMSQAMQDLAHDIATESGLIWKIWTVNESTKEAGGIYYFTNEQDAKRYLIKHIARLQNFGIDQVNGKIFEVNADLSHINKAPI